MNNSLNGKTLRFLNTSEPVTTLYRDLAPELARRGATVELLVSKAAYRAERKISEAFVNEPRIRVRRTFAGPFKTYTGAISKLSVHFFYSLHSLLIMLFGKRVDLNIFLTQPPLFFVLAPLIRKINGTPYVLVVMDLQPDEYVEFGFLKRDSWLTKSMDKLAKKSFVHANFIIAIGRCMADLLTEKGVKQSNLAVIPNWTTRAEQINMAARTNPLRIESGWLDKFIVLYGGNIGNAQNFKDLVEVANSLKQYSRIFFVIVGGGMRAEEISTAIHDRGLTNIILLPFLHGQYPVHTIYGAGDVNFISLREECTGHGVPSKAYVSLVSGRPILFQGSPDCEIARMVNEEQIGMTVRTESELRDAVLHMYASPEVVEAMGLKAASLVSGEYSSSNLVQRYVLALSSAL